MSPSGHDVPPLLLSVRSRTPYLASLPPREPRTRPPAVAGVRVAVSEVPVVVAVTPVIVGNVGAGAGVGSVELVNVLDNECAAEMPLTKSPVQVLVSVTGL